MRRLKTSKMNQKSTDREQPSLDYMYYAMVFRPDLFKEMILREKMEYGNLKNSMPERFELNNFDKVFLSWFKELKFDVKNLPSLDLVSSNKFNVRYDHDNHTYSSDHYISNSLWKGVTTKELCVKLANNGFIYSKPVAIDGINVFQNAQPRHRSTTFVYLDVSHISSLKEMKKFAGAYLGTNQLSLKMFYDFHTHRFDFKAYMKNDRNKGVVITFEDLPVMDDNFNEDYWLEVDVDDIESIERDTSK